MLKDYLIDWCQEESNNSHAGNCGHHCNNKNFCTHNCDDCLDQVHWYPSSDGRADYTCHNLLLRYVLRFTQKYSQQIASALRMINQAEYPRFNILSIGCGGTPDLMAFEEETDRPIYYCGYDRNIFWSEIHDKIEEYVAWSRDIDANLYREDIFDALSTGISSGPSYNVIVIQYLLSHLFNTNQEHLTSRLFNALIKDVIHNHSGDSPFLIIITDVDSVNKGRNRWFTFLDMLEDAGFHGNAYARSAYPTGDLGRERWSRHKTSRCFGNINYTYFPNESEHDGAQLIIELR